MQKYVPQLIVTDGGGQETLLTNQKEVETEIFSFYKNLYPNKDLLIEFNSIEEFLAPQNHQHVPKVEEAQKDKMKGKISVQEMTRYLKKCKNNVSPGSSGFTNDFYKFFWRDLKHFVINAVDYAFDNNRLSATQSLGIISIIPKGEKDKRFLNNWRPLTLLNTLYKLISGCVAERIKPALPSLIHPDQKGFVAGRYIGEAIRTTYDTIHYAKTNNRAGLILLIDFEKAYDSISFKFINQVLNFFNFDEDICKWVNILLNNFNAVINHCGNISEMEIYADDLTIFLEPCRQNLRTVVSHLGNFYKLSGLKISVSKTKAIWFGSEHNSDLNLCPDLNLKWVKTFTLLGITFNNNLENMQCNFVDKIEKIDKMLSNWSYRYLTPFGKVTIVKTLGLSKLSHVALVSPNPTKEMVKQIETIFYQFIWNKKSEKVRRDDCKLPVKLGGLGMPDISKFWSSFKFSWFRRLLSTEAFWPKILLKNVSKVTNNTLTVSELLQLGATKLAEISRKIQNPFWKQVLSTAMPITLGAAFCFPENFSSSPFFYNPLVTRQRPVGFGIFPEITNTVSYIADFFYPGTNNIMEWNDFCNHYNVIISQEKYIDIRFSIKTAIQKLKLPQLRLQTAQYPIKPLLIDIAMSCKKGCSSYYKLLTKKDSLTNGNQNRENKWHTELNLLFSTDFWENSRKLCASIEYDNQLKWLNYQIIRNCLQTNYIVSHFKPNVSPVCSYCRNPNSLEKISHLFYFCPVVNDFLVDVCDLICSTGFNYAPTMRQFIFGFHDKAYHQPENYISLIIKKYIWTTKFKSATLIMAGFKGLMKTYLSDLKFIFVKKDAPEKFNEWNTIVDNL